MMINCGAVLRPKSHAIKNNMENLLLESIAIKYSGVKVELTENNLKLIFSDDVIELTYNHDQDCCEQVYADFGTIRQYIPQLNDKYKTLEIKAVPELGFLLCFEKLFGEGYEKILIPCYNEQNGYYNDKLELEINHNGVIKKIDITQCNNNK